MLSNLAFFTGDALNLVRDMYGNDNRTSPNQVPQGLSGGSIENHVRQETHDFHITFRAELWSSNIGTWHFFLYRVSC